MTRTRKTCRPPAPAHAAFRPKPLALLIGQAFAAAALLGPASAALAAAPAPGTRIPLTALPTGASTQGAVGSIGGRTIYSPQIVNGNFGATPYSVQNGRDGTVTGTITQLSNAGILQWDKFDIGADATVNIRQPSSTAVLLNKVADGDYNHAVLIEGRLNADGQVYIYNPNGIIFGKSSQINVNSLVATSLKIADGRFLAGITVQDALKTPIFAADPAVGTPGAIEVEGDSAASRAQLTTRTGGRIMLVGPSVVNNGVLTAPDGQVVLAAGGKVYVVSPNDVTMRGLVVEVANDNLAAAGKAENGELGNILVGRGNATMVGLAVNQKGLISATTSVALNGSIYLHARDGGSISNEGLAVSGHGGDLVLGENSVTEVLPDLEDKTTSTGAAFHASVVDLAGNTVHLEGNAAGTGGATVVAPGGNVTIDAAASAGKGHAYSPTGSSHIYLDSGTSIDVSGSRSAELAMESNVIQIQLRGTELADSPLQRTSVVRGQTVSIDIRKGTSLADVSGYLKLVEHGIGEQTAAGGTINFKSDTDVVVDAGATLDVSGGIATYKPGYITTTKLTSGGVAYDIGSAPSDRVYDGFYTPGANPRNYQAGYVDGYSAGTITVNAPSLVARGNLKGEVTRGALQRTVGATNWPLGGQLIIGNADTKGDLSKLHFGGSVALNGETTAGVLVPSFDTGLNLPDAMRAGVDIAASTLARNGFSRMQVYADEGSIRLAKGLTLPAGGELTLSADSGVEIGANITSPGGTVKVSSPYVKVDSGVAIDVAGRWTNDRANASPARDADGNPVTPIVLNGGSISLVAPSVSGPSQVVIGDDVSLDVSGGAWLNAQGKQTAGSGGSITLGPSLNSTNLPTFQDLSLGRGLVLRGYGVGSGGTLKITAPNVLLGATSTDESTLALTAAWFQQGGFTNFDVQAGGNLTVDAGAVIAPRADNWFARTDTSTTASGRMADAFDVASLPLGSATGSRKAASLSLRAVREDNGGDGVLAVRQGAILATDPGGKVTLTAGSLLEVDGSVAAPGGTINLYLSPKSGAVALAERSIWLGSAAVVDASTNAGSLSAESLARVRQSLGETWPSSLWTDTRGITQGSLLDGGTINIGRAGDAGLDAALGYLMVRPGARLDVSGTTATMTVSRGRSGLATSTVASNGGSVSIRAREGLLFGGSMAGAAGNGSARGGSLFMAVDGQDQETGSYSTADLVIAGRVPSAGVIPAGLTAGAAITGVAGSGFVTADALNGAGFDTLRLKSSGTMTFDLSGGDISLDARSGLILNAPTLASRNAADNSTVSLNAPYVALGNGDYRYQGSPRTATVGKAALLVNASSTADLIGKSTLDGFGSARFNVNGDVRMTGLATQVSDDTAIDLSSAIGSVLPALYAPGSFTVAGAISFSSAQVYPTSMSEFRLAATGDSGTVTFNGNANSDTAAVPLSAAGTLKVSAREISQNGVVRAPLGKIEFDADTSLTYGAGSLTSVAGSSSVPLGFVQNGTDWLYDFGNGHTVNLGDSTATNAFNLPDKTIVSRAPAVNLASKATLDLSGGGDLYAYEFTPGPGGTKDVLAVANTFAVIPGFTAPAPTDFQYQYGQSGPNVGDRVYLSGIPGLAAGFYTLLPAHYALQPGAYAITTLSGSANMSPVENRRTALGTWLVAGYRTSFGGADNQWQGFTVTPGSLVRQQSEFSDYAANAFLPSAGVTRPMDGGHVVFDVGRSLAIDGLVKLNAAPGGQSGIADISAAAITIVSDLAQALPAEADGDAVKLAASDLNALGADSLLLGGVRTQTSSGQTITVGAGQVIVANDSDHTLKAPEVLLVAGSTETLVADPKPSDPGHMKASPASGSAGQGMVLVKSGSSIAATGTLTHAPQAITLVNKSNPDGLGADGAMLRVSSGAPVEWNRSFVSSDGTVVGAARAAGTLKVEAGASISASGSLAYDATGTTSVDAAPAVASGVALQYGANHISLGSSAPADVDGLRFDDGALATLSRLQGLSLHSYSTLDVYGVVSLGKTATNTMDTLTLTATGIQACGNRCDGGSDDSLRQATFAANTVRLAGSGGVAAATTVPTTGANYAKSSLTVEARNIEIGSNTLAIQGYANTALNASGYVRAAGSGGTVAATADMTVKAGRIVANTGADATFAAAKRLELKQYAAAPADGLPAQLGGRLAFTGDSIASSAVIQATAGRIAMTATGAGGIDITGGELNAAGSAQEFGSTVAYAPGGQITLDAGTGNVLVAGAATLDVSAAGAAAGTLSVKAISGTASLGGTLKGSSNDGQTKGQFALDVGSVGTAGQFTDLNDKLNAGGFTESRSVRARSGDIEVADKGLDTGGNRIDAITAHDVVLAADDGDISVKGQINASGAKGGSIQLYAAEQTAGLGRGKVTIEGTAVLNASATTAATGTAGSIGNGGSIVIGTAIANGSAPTTTSGEASIGISAGADLNVGGMGSGQGGTVVLRAPRLATNDDVAIAALDGSAIRGSRSTVIEGYKVYTASTISADADSTTNLQVANASGAPAGLMFTDANTFVGNQSRIFGRFSNAGSIVLQPGLEVRSAGDLTVSVNEGQSIAKQNRGWDLNQWRFQDRDGNYTQPGVLTLRATGDLIVQGSISDGFKKTSGASMPDWDLDPTGNSSWSYRLGGGSDLKAANPLATVPSTSAGDVKLTFARVADSSGTDYPVALVRTGTGSITLAAGRDVILDTLDLTKGTALGGNYANVDFTTDKLLGASVYTAGIQSATSPATAPINARNSVYGSSATSSAKFTQGGGAISVYADRNVFGPVTRQLINNWLFRQGQVTTDSAGNTVFANSLSGRTYSGPLQYTAWWSRFDYFNEGIATFGGGDITIRANTGNVVDVAASAATSGFYTPVTGKLTEGATRTEYGGGDLAITAGGDIQGGVFYVQKGSASLAAQGDITTGNRKVVDTKDGLTTPVALAPVLAAGDAQFSVVARGNLDIEAVFNPTLFIQSTKNVPKAATASADLFTNFTDQLSYFSTYSPESAAKLTSIAGDVVLRERWPALIGAGGTELNWNQGTDRSRLALVHPGSLTVAALSGDLSLGDGFSLWPSATGELQLLAKGSVSASNSLSQAIVMIDQDPATLMAAAAPTIPKTAEFNTITGNYYLARGLAYHTDGGLHAGDAEPVRVVALDGDISFKANDTNTVVPAALVLPKSAEIIAGRDIVDTGFVIQNLAATDVTTVRAGRDIIDTTLPSTENTVTHIVTGPGRIDFTAGRNFDLGNSAGVVTRGNLDNPYLPSEGAAINVVAGATPDYACFAAQVGSPAGFTAADRTALLDYVRRIDPTLPSDLSVDDAWTKFNSLSAGLRRPFYDTLFFSALQRESGVVGGGTLDLAGFDATIASLFPTESIGGGNINVFGSQLKTARGGAINLYAPGGSVYAGLVSIPNYLKSKAQNSPADLGIFTIAGGPIQALVKTDFLVNQGRVFSLGGGDVTVVSQYGNIDAGRGSKTAQAAPPPILTTDKDGNTQVDISGSISGSGIATLKTSDDVADSNVYVITPRGTFDAGDAGVRSTGSVSIAAAAVLNASNISAGGSVSGAKTVDSGAFGGAAMAPAAPPVATDAFAAPAAADPSVAGSLTVELLGYGGDGQQSVTQDGQNGAPPESDDQRKKKRSL